MASLRDLFGVWRYPGTSMPGCLMTSLRDWVRVCARYWLFASECSYAVRASVRACCRLLHGRGRPCLHEPCTGEDARGSTNLARARTPVPPRTLLRRGRAWLHEPCMGRTPVAPRKLMHGRGRAWLHEPCMGRTPAPPTKVMHGRGRPCLRASLCTGENARASTVEDGGKPS